MPAKKKTTKAPAARKTSTAARAAKKATKGTKAAAKKRSAAAAKPKKVTKAAKAPAAAKKKASSPKKVTKAAKAPAAAKKKASSAKKGTKAAKAPAAAKKKASSAKKAPAKQRSAPAPKQASSAKKAPAKQRSAPAASGHDAAIARIEAKAAAAGVRLAEGASAKAIKAAEKAIGLALPEEVVAFYRRHDGAESEPAVEGRELLSLSRMVNEWKIWKDLFDQGTFEENDHGRPGPGVRQRWWIPEWVPVTYDGAGNHHVIDLAPAKGGTHGQILSFWHDDDSRTVVAKGFLAWLESAAWPDEVSADRLDGES